MTMLARRWFWVAVAVQVLFLVGIIGIHGYTLATGQPVLLKSVPVDPWDAFRGQYVNLRFDISRLDEATMPMAGAPYQQGDTVYVTLHEGNPFWTATGVAKVKPLVAKPEIVIRGTVESFFEGKLSVRYGLEQFYVPEGEGQNLDQRRDALSVEALVDATGRGALHKLFLDGKEISWK
jgi:uncharacterized membrane-anchored protein